MKNFIVLLFLLIAFGCGSTKVHSTVASKESPKQTALEQDDLSGPPEERLAKILRRQSGVFVTERGGQYDVQIRGGYTNFTVGNIPPLFIVDGQDAGRNMQVAAQQIQGKRIVNVEILKGSDASIYGSRGGSGVIKIKTAPVN